jgi:hypothetical protein
MVSIMKVAHTCVSATPARNHSHRETVSCGMLALATKKLGDVGAGRRREPCHKGIDNLLLLGDREPSRRNVADDVSTHRIRRVLSREQRISGSLPEVNTCRPSRTLTISVRDGQLDVSVILGIGCRRGANASSRKRLGDRVDGDGLRIAEQGTCLPTGVSPSSWLLEGVLRIPSGS